MLYISILYIYLLSKLYTITNIYINYWNWGCPMFKTNSSKTQKDMHGSGCLRSCVVKCKDCYSRPCRLRAQIWSMGKPKDLGGCS